MNFAVCEFCGLRILRFANFAAESEKGEGSALPLIESWREVTEVDILPVLKDGDSRVSGIVRASPRLAGDTEVSGSYNLSTRVNSALSTPIEAVCQTGQEKSSTAGEYACSTYIPVLKRRFYGR